MSTPVCQKECKEPDYLVLFGVQMVIGMIVWVITPLNWHDLPNWAHVGIVATLAFILAQSASALCLMQGRLKWRNYRMLLVPLAICQLGLMSAMEFTEIWMGF